MPFFTYIFFKVDNLISFVHMQLKSSQIFHLGSSSHFMKYIK